MPLNSYACYCIVHVTALCMVRTVIDVDNISHVVSRHCLFHKLVSHACLFPLQLVVGVWGQLLGCMAMLGLLTLHVTINC